MLDEVGTGKTINVGTELERCDAAISSVSWSGIAVSSV